MPRRRPVSSSPGIVLDELNAQLRGRLMFGPRPATHDHCTLGGMIGNNSCGATAQAYGKTVDNVVRLEVLTYDGERFWAGPASDDEYAAIVAAGGGAARLPGPARAVAGPRRRDPAALPADPAPGLRIQPGLTASRAGLQRGQGAGRQREHPGHDPARRAEPGPGARGQDPGRARLPGHRRRGRRRAPDRAAPAGAAGRRRRPADHFRARAADEPRGAPPAAGRPRVAHGRLLRRLPGRGRRQGAGPDRRAARHRARADRRVLRRPGTREGTG